MEKLYKIGELAKACNTTLKTIRYYEEKELIKSFFLITSKPIIYCANISDTNLMENNGEGENVNLVKDYAKSEGAETVVVCAKLEEELSDLEGEELELFKAELGITLSGLDKLIIAGYKLLGLISYLTAGEDETRAWTIKNGTKAPQAAGKIHTDFERGFIKAEVVNYKDLLEHGSLAAAREKGLVGMEGKEYVVKDGDVILFRFNV